MFVPTSNQCHRLIYLPVFKNDGGNLESLQRYDLVNTKCSFIVH